MSKPIKVEDKIYDELDRLKVGRQTFSDVVGDLLKVRVRVLELLSVIEGSLRYQERATDRLQKVADARLERVDLESRIIPSPILEPKKREGD